MTNTRIYKKIRVKKIISLKLFYIINFNIKFKKIKNYNE